MGLMREFKAWNCAVECWTVQRGAVQLSVPAYLAKAIVLKQKWEKSLLVYSSDPHTSLVISQITEYLEERSIP